MTDTLTLQVVVHDPHPEVHLRMQRGRFELVEPVHRADNTLTFELRVDAVTRADGVVALKGPEVQGPPAGRFVYVNAGTYAGGPPSPWSRRAKVPLGGISPAMVPLLGSGWSVVSAGVRTF